MDTEVIYSDLPNCQCWQHIPVVTTFYGSLPFSSFTIISLHLNIFNHVCNFFSRVPILQLILALCRLHPDLTVLFASTVSSLMSWVSDSTSWRRQACSLSKWYVGWVRTVVNQRAETLCKDYSAPVNGCRVRRQAQVARSFDVWCFEIIRKAECLCEIIQIFKSWWIFSKINAWTHKTYMLVRPSWQTSIFQPSFYRFSLVFNMSRRFKTKYL